MPRESRFPVKWKPLKFTRADYLSLEKIRKRHGPILRRGISRPWAGISALEERATQTVRGSLEERIVYKALDIRGVPFSFQSSMDGGRLELGGMVADFILRDRRVIIRVQGTVWHDTTVSKARDEYQRAIMENYGYTVMDIWDWEVRDRILFDSWMKRNIDRGIIL